MNKKMSKRQKNIKTKLMAAICMLLVSSIMMVSTTYAWFTLSTAPEVTGITTAVGANGNLEMALLPVSGETAEIKSNVGDSLQADKDRNLTWGNLVDLSDNTTYGLDTISLYPSALNVGADGKLQTAPLKFPSYGADGRVANLLPNTLTGIYNSTAGTFSPDADDATSYGVRAVGSASGMTDRQMSYRNARAAANTAKSYAATLAAQSLDANGDALAGIAIKKGTNDAPTFTPADIATLDAIISDLTEDGGIFDQIETAYMQYVLAYAASAKTGTEDLAWNYVKGLVEADGATINSVIEGIENPTGYDGSPITIPDAVKNGIAAFNATVAKVDSTSEPTGAKQKLAALGTKDEYSWKDISPVLNALANPTAMEINGIKAGEINQDGNIDALINSVIGGKGVNVVIASGGGVYADIAEQTANFQADVKIQEITYAGKTFGPVDAKMKTNAPTPSVLDRIGTAVETAGAPASGATGSVPISDMYGYIIDMAFRTNAASSNLVLQQQAIDRIYKENTEGVEVAEETTMGHGANMTFASVNPSFDNEKVKDLMRAIRVVFFNPDDGTIIKYAKLNVDAATTTADGAVKADIILCDLSTGADQEIFYTGTETDTENGGITYTIYYTDSSKTTPFCRSYKETVDSAKVEKWQVYDNATSTYGTAQETKPENIPSETVAGKDTLVPAADQKIMALTQNTATKLSVLVYLDGEEIGNEDVASNGSKSVTGTMNLQFSSDGNLTPMNYTPLMNQDTTSESEGESSTTTEATP